MDLDGTLVWGVLLAVAGIAACSWLLKAMFFPLFKDTKSLSQRIRFKQKERLVKTADQLISTNAYLEAFEILQKAFLFEGGSFDSETIEKIHNHHIGILSRIVLVAEKLARRIDNLAIIEDLLLSRSEMLRALIEARSSRENLRSRKKRDAPQWALDEYQRKIEEIADKLKTNQFSLETQVKKAYSILQRGQEDQQITYH